MNHYAPVGYVCPLCRIVAGAERDAVVYRDEVVVAALSLHQKANNLGSLLVFPSEHIENLYTAPSEKLNSMFSVSRRLALALKHSLGAEGVTLLQNNEPAGGQDVWHIHAHVIPRYRDDQYFSRRGQIASIDDRERIAKKVRSALEAV
jgi:histidine triad (HIT) family protein